MTKRPLEFAGNSYEELCDFPKAARRAAGAELLKVQLGSMPSDFKPMHGIGRGVYEVRVHVGGEWRVLFVTKFEAAIFVLHAFHKKTLRTSKHDLKIAVDRYKELVSEVGKGGE
jgi:phage-related protein